MSRVKKYQFGGNFAGLENMFNAISAEDVFMALLAKDCPHLVIDWALPQITGDRNKFVFKKVSSHRLQYPREVSCLHNTFTLLASINATMESDAYMADIGGKIPEAKDCFVNVKAGLWDRKPSAAEMAAQLYLQADKHVNINRAWLLVRDFAVGRLEKSASWGKWKNLDEVTKTIEEMRTGFEVLANEYRIYRKVDNPEFDVDYLMMPLEDRILFTLEVVPNLHPSKKAHRDVNTGHFEVGKRDDIMLIVIDYRFGLEFVRMTKSPFGDDKYLMDLMCKHVFGAKLVPHPNKMRRLDRFATREMAKKITVPNDIGCEGDTAKIASIDLCYTGNLQNFSYSPITVHDFAGDNIFDQIDELLPDTNFPEVFRSVNYAVVSVTLHHQKDIKSAGIYAGSTTTYKITFKPKSIGFSPQIENPDTCPDYQHKVNIKKLIKYWGLEGDAPNNFSFK